MEVLIMENFLELNNEQMLDIDGGSHKFKYITVQNKEELIWIIINLISLQWYVEKFAYTLHF